MNANQSLAGWMVYAACMSALFGLVAAGAEEFVRRRGGSVRALWGISLCAAIVLPLLAWSWGRSMVPASGAASPRAAAPAATAHVSWAEAFFALDAAGAPGGGGSKAITVASVRNLVRVPSLTRFNGIARSVVIGAPLIYALWLMVAWLSLRARRRSWREGTLNGTAVLISPDFGPAIVGLRHPRIVVPEWATSLTPEERRLMVAHEQEHLAAHDGRAVTLALCAVAIMPWNLALWSQIRRFRLAVEMDCDARLLREIRDIRQYGGLLLEVARRAPGASPMVAALVERPSALRRRIEAMTACHTSVPRRRVARDLAVVLVAVTAACAITPPADKTASKTDSLAPRAKVVVSQPARAAETARAAGATTVRPNADSLKVVVRHLGDSASFGVAGSRAAPANLRDLGARKATLEDSDRVTQNALHLMFDGLTLSADQERDARAIIKAEYINGQAMATSGRSEYEAWPLLTAARARRDTALAALLTSDADRATFMARANVEVERMIRLTPKWPEPEPLPR